MSLLFADIYDGIRTIRITKGVSEKDILNYVQEKVGGCLNVANVLKTIRTLKKLCDDGVLIKKGKRYVFAPKGSRKEQEDDDDDDEGEDEEEGCQEEIQPQMPDSCDEGGDNDDNNEENQEEKPQEEKPQEEEPQEEEPQEEEEEDDDDDEEEDDDDDDDEDECDEKDVQANNEETIGKKNNEMETRKSIKSKNSFLVGGNSPPGGSNGDNGTPNCLDKKVNRTITGDCMKKAGDDKVKKCKVKSVVDHETGDATKNNEAIAFCVRDFIDSLGQPDAEGKEQSQKSEAMLEENMDLTKPLEFGREVSLRKRAFRSKRNAGRSRSPVKEIQAELYHCLGKGPSDEIGFRAVSSNFFQEPTDVEMELDQKKDEELTTLHRSLPTNSGEPCGEADKDMQDSVIIEPSYDDFRASLAKKTSLMCQVQNNECAMGQMTWYPLEEREKETEAANRSLSYEDDMTGGDKEKTVSLCSVCEKKKRIS